MQRVVGIALGYEDLNDHDELRHDPVLAVLAGKLAAKRADCAPLAGKSTLNRLELSRPEPRRYHKVSHDAAAIEALFVEVFLEAQRRAPLVVSPSFTSLVEVHRSRGRRSTTGRSHRRRTTPALCRRTCRHRARQGC
jgi:hypothetical protein